MAIGSIRGGARIFRKKGGPSFLKKRSKKLFSVGFRARSSKFTSGGDGAGAKVFCFFFSKKKFFLLHLLIVAAPARAGPPFVTDDPVPVAYQGWEINCALLGTAVQGGGTADKATMLRIWHMETAIG
jgi:hypothetical protein